MGIIVRCNIDEGNGSVGIYGTYAYDKPWSYTYSHLYNDAWTIGKSMTIEVYNVNGYEIESVTGSSGITNLSGPYNLDRGKYWRFTLSADEPTLTVTYRQGVTKHTVTTSSSPSSGGTTSGGGTYNHGVNVTINAFAADGYSFDYWSENGSWLSDSPSYSFYVLKNRNFVAHFKERTKYTVTTSSSPSSGGTTRGSGTYYSGVNVTIEAIASDGYRFDYWSENGVKISESPTYSFYVLKNRNFVAHFISSTNKITIYNYIKNQSSTTTQFLHFANGRFEKNGESVLNFYGATIQTPQVFSTNDVVKLVLNNVGIATVERLVVENVTDLEGPFETPTGVYYTFRITDNATIGIFYTGYLVDIELVTSPLDPYTGKNVGRLESRWALFEEEFSGANRQYVPGMDIEIQAIDQNPDYTFVRWETGQEGVARIPYHIQNIGGRVTAFFKEKGYAIITLAHVPPEVNIDIEINDATNPIIPLGNNKYKVKERDYITINPIFNDPTYVFVQWELNGQFFSDNPRLSFYVPPSPQAEIPIYSYKLVAKPLEFKTHKVTVRILPRKTEFVGRLELYAWWYDPYGHEHSETYVGENEDISVDLYENARFTVRASGAFRPDEGYMFEKWTGDIGDNYLYDPLITFAVNNTDRIIYANFTTNITVVIRPVPIGAGDVSVADPAVYIGNYNYNIAMGARLSMTAIEKRSDYHFDHWELDGKDRRFEKNLVISSMTKQDYREYVAYFIGSETATVTTIAVPEEGGAIAGGGVYAVGSIATVTATPWTQQGWQFSHWSTGEKEQSITFTVKEDITLKAYFTKIPTPPTPSSGFSWLSLFTKRKKKHKIMIVK